jgi:threonylcarbamoyladenosine tRNA methylthiotransferase MtaB
MAAKSRLHDLLTPLLDLPAPGGGHWRLRLSSIESGEVTDELLALMTRPRCCPHLHVPLQSGSDAVLARMNRPTGAAEYLATVARARAALDEPAFTTDVIVGFPGETEADFQATVDLCRAVGFLKIHVFPFSPRAGTPAAGMPGQVPAEGIRRRARELRDLSDELAADFVRRFVGRRERVLVERTRGGCAVGHADRYFQVALPAGPKPGDLVDVQLTSAAGPTAAGHTVS